MYTDEINVHNLKLLLNDQKLVKRNISNDFRKKNSYFETSAMHMQLYLCHK